MVPTADARITRQMLYSATPPVTTFVRLAILPPVNATWYRVGTGNKSTPARSLGRWSFPSRLPPVISQDGGEPGFQRRKARIAPFIYGWAQVVKNGLCGGLKGEVSGLAAFVLKLRLDSRAGNFSFFCR